MAQMRKAELALARAEMDHAEACVTGLEQKLQTEVALARAKLAHAKARVLELEAEAEAEMKANEFALGNAAKEGNVERVRSLLDVGVDVDASLAGRSPLMHAAAEGYVDCVRLLLQRGANANALDTAGQTAKDLAAAGGHADVVQLLLDHMGDSLSDSLRVEMLQDDSSEL